MNPSQESQAPAANHDLENARINDGIARARKQVYDDVERLLTGHAKDFFLISEEREERIKYLKFQDEETREKGIKYAKSQEKEALANVCERWETEYEDLQTEEAEQLMRLVMEELLRHIHRIERDYVRKEQEGENGAYQGEIRSMLDNSQDFLDTQHLTPSQLQSNSRQFLTAAKRKGAYGLDIVQGIKKLSLSKILAGLYESPEPDSPPAPFVAKRQSDFPRLPGLQHPRQDTSSSSVRQDHTLGQLSDPDADKETSLGLFVTPLKNHSLHQDHTLDQLSHLDADRDTSPGLFVTPPKNHSLYHDHTLNQLSDPDSDRDPSLGLFFTSSKPHDKSLVQASQTLSGHPANPGRSLMPMIPRGYSRHEHSQAPTVSYDTQINMSRKERQTNSALESNYVQRKTFSARRHASRSPQSPTRASKRRYQHKASLIRSTTDSDSDASFTGQSSYKRNVSSISQTTLSNYAPTTTFAVKYVGFRPESGLPFAWRDDELYYQFMHAAPRPFLKIMKGLESPQGAKALIIDGTWDGSAYRFEGKGQLMRKNGDRLRFEFRDDAEYALFWDIVAKINGCLNNGNECPQLGHPSLRFDREWGKSLDAHRLELGLPLDEDEEVRQRRQDAERKERRRQRR